MCEYASVQNGSGCGSCDDCAAKHALQMSLCSMQSSIKRVSMQVSKMFLDAVLVTTVLPSIYLANESLQHAVVN